MKIKKSIIVTLFIVIVSCSSFSQVEKKNDEKAIMYLKEMINTMGGLKLWAEMKQLTFTHKWHPINRESYLEDEIIDLTGPRSWVKMKSEIFERIRAYSPEHGYWALHNGEFSTNEKSLENAIKRAPFNIYRIAHAIASENFLYEVRMGKTDIPTGVKIEFVDKDGTLGGSVVLNGKNEPLVWEIRQFKYTFGPMEKYGNLFVPKWSVYNQGSFLYEMVDLVGDNYELDTEVFKQPSDQKG